MQKLATVSQETKQPQRKDLKILTYGGFQRKGQISIPSLCTRNSKMFPRLPDLMYTFYMILGTVILTDFIPMIKLCYMAQLTWRQGDYLGRPDLLWANEEQRDFFATLEKRKSKIQITRQIPCALLTWRWRGPHDKQCGQPPGESRPSRQSIRKLRS